MHKLSPVLVFTALLAFGGLIGADAGSAELEGALQYPPPSVGEDAQPPPPARMVPPLVAPRRIELGAGRSSLSPSLQRSLIRPPIRWMDLENPLDAAEVSNGEAAAGR
jgi:hypothetical protein